MKCALIIPVLNAKPWLEKLFSALKSLDPHPDHILFIDSSSTDGTPEEIVRAGFSLHTIKREDFGHGKTRNLGAELCKAYDILIYMTQDAIPATPDMVALIKQEFSINPAVGVVCGRQLPHEDANVASRYARLHNYPPHGYTMSAADIPLRGIRALFCSNSFAAYRTKALFSVGGFPEHLPLGEDMAVTGRLLEAGLLSVYKAEACVYHSHNYRVSEEFRRYFDIGALLKIDPWLKERSLKSGGEGLRYVLGELSYSLRNGAFLDVVSIFPRTFAKYAGFKLGNIYSVFPLFIVRYCSMHKFFWKTEA